MLILLDYSSVFLLSIIDKSKYFLEFSFCSTKNVHLPSIVLFNTIMELLTYTFYFTFFIIIYIFLFTHFYTFINT